MQGGDMNGPGYKRPRTTGGRGEGDWTCPNCGNVNFAFRTTCNMRKCSTPKPGSMPPANVMPPAPPPGSMAPSMYEPAPVQYITQGGPPPVGSYIAPAGYTTAPVMMPPQVPQSYNMPPSYPTQTSYMPVIAPQVPPGASYRAPQLDQFGRVAPALPMGVNGMTQSPATFSPQDGRKRRGGPEGSSEGDWVCPKCGNTNFAFRSVCNMRKCSEPKPAPAPPPVPVMNGGPRISGPGSFNPPQGSWTCKACGNINYPFRTHCNRRNCGAEKPADAPQPVPLTVAQ